MKKRTIGNPITTREELLAALIEEVSKSVNVRQPNDFTLSEFVEEYTKRTGSPISHDMAYKKLKAAGFHNHRVGRNEYVWRKPQ